MLLIDANAILRYILCDIEDMAEQVEELLEREIVTVQNEVLAEVVYVLGKVYKLSRTEISSVIVQFLNLSNVEIRDKPVIILALETFGQTKLDFVDTLLYAYYILKDAEVFTFDKELRSKMG